MIDTNLEKIRAEISRLESEHQRERASVTLLAVSKRKPLSDIQEAVEAGQIAFGENYWVQGVDRAKIIERLALHRPQDLPPLNLCLQVNIDSEDSKSGCRPEEIPALARLTDSKPNLNLRGIMAIPAPPSGITEQRKVFAEVRHVYDALREEFPHVDTLSMGMSADMEAAIAEGATMVRVGTAIFGRRD